MNALINILQQGTANDLKVLSPQISIDNLDVPLPTCNLRPISYAALCGNLEIVDYLFTQGCSVNVADSSDCNLLTWSLMCPVRQSRKDLLQYIWNRKVHEQFQDQTQDILKFSSSELNDLSNTDIITQDGLSVMYYKLLLGDLNTSFDSNLFKQIKIVKMIQANLTPNEEDSKLRRIARYFYIAGYFCNQYHLHELAQDSYTQSISHFNLIKNKSPCDCREFSYIYNSLGNIYCKLSQWDHAIDCFEKAVTTHNKIDDKLLVDHQELTNYRSNLAGYMQDEVKEDYFNRIRDYLV